jgi:hypothetical protein
MNAQVQLGKKESSVEKGGKTTELRCLLFWSRLHKYTYLRGFIQGGMHTSKGENKAPESMKLAARQLLLAI